MIFMIVDVEDAGSGPGSVPRASVMVRDGLLCFLLSFLKMGFILLSELWCSKRGNITLAYQSFNSNQSLIHPFLLILRHIYFDIYYFTTEHGMYIYSLCY